MSQKFIDIGVNITDEMYQGIYHGKKKHEGDLENVLKRAWDGGLHKIIMTGTNLSDSKTAIDLCKKDERLYSTVGCHPTRCNEFDSSDTSPDQYLEDLLKLAQDNLGKVVAIGECGLDYDRTNFCSIEVQKKYFEKQISLAEVTGLPMFLHCRAAARDLVSILSPRRENIRGGVVHSFDGTEEELQLFLDLDLFVGINGCSLKTAENLRVAAQVPRGRLLLETDAPWCEIKAPHAGFLHVKTKFEAVKKPDKFEFGKMVKGRNEPAAIVQVLEVMAAIRGESADDLSSAVFENTMRLFFGEENQ